MSNIPENRQRIGPARGAKYRVLPRRITYQSTRQPRSKFCLDTVNLEEALSDLSSDDCDEKDDVNVKLAEAIELSMSGKFEEARDMAENVQQVNPTDSTALCVNALECESRQDWSEAARFFLVGLGQNDADGTMEHGFHTNVDMLRTQRHKWYQRVAPNKWDDVLTFKPRPPRLRPPSPDEKPPWWRLGPWYEELFDETGFLSDLLQAQQDPDEQTMECRRIVYENMDYLNNVYTFYRDDLNDTFAPEQAVPGSYKHDGHETIQGEHFMKLSGLWRLLKECKVVYGDTKTKLPLAVFDRIMVQGKRRIAMLAETNAGLEVADIDPHDREIEIKYYDFIETLLRSAHVKLQGTLAARFESLIKEYLRPFAMRKQTDKSFLDYRSLAVKEFLRNKEVDTRMRRTFEFFVSSYKSNKLKSNSIGPRDITMSFNHSLSLLDRFDILDPSLTTKKAVDLFSKITLDTDLLPQEHPNNQNSEMIFDEFCEFVMRCAKVKSLSAKESMIDALERFVEELFIRAARVIPGKF